MCVQTCTCVRAHTHMHVAATNEKRGQEFFLKQRKSVWEDLEGGKGKEKLFKLLYITISKRKIRIKSKINQK